MGMGFAPTWLRQVSPPHLLHMTTLTTGCVTFPPHARLFFGDRVPFLRLFNEKWKEVDVCDAVAVLLLSNVQGGTEIS